MYIFLIVIFLSTTQSANILGIFTYPAYSHQTFSQKFYRELSLRGHQVTVICTHGINDPSLTNLTEIVIPGATVVWNSTNAINLLSKNAGYSGIIKTIFDVQYFSNLKMVKNSKVKNLIQNRLQKFDLILKGFISGFSFAFADRFNAPVIDISPSNSIIHVNNRYGFSTNQILNPDIQINLNTRGVTLKEKIESFYYLLWSEFYYRYYELPRLDKLARKFFGEKVPSLRELERKSSMYFKNTNPLFHHSRPNVPNVIEVMPVDRKSSKQLPPDLRKLMDEANNGIVYVNFGSNIKSSTMDKELHKTIKEVISELPYTVLWKWESDFMEDQPSNVVTRKWFPQPDLLVHPNIKVFVTQAGAHSILESIGAEVPMVAIPFIADQITNAKRIVELGIGEEIDTNTLTKKYLLNSIISVAKMKRYRTNIMNVRKILYDTSKLGIDNAIWWSEYVIRHKGAKHLRNYEVDQGLLEYFLLDVLLITIVCTFLSLYVSYKFIVVLWQYLCNRLCIYHVTGVKIS